MLNKLIYFINCIKKCNSLIAYFTDGLKGTLSISTLFIILWTPLAFSQQIGGTPSGFSDPISDSTTSDTTTSDTTTSDTTTSDTTTSDTTSPWSGTNLTIGADYDNDSTTSFSLSTSATLSYLGTKWAFELAPSYDLLTAEGITPINSYETLIKIDYILDPSVYRTIEINSIYTKDPTSDYKYTSATGLLYGQNIINNTSVTLAGHIGPGWRYYEPLGQVLRYSQPCFLIMSDLTWNFTDTNSLDILAKATFGKPYNAYETNITLTTDITKSISIQWEADLQYRDSLPKNAITNNLFAASSTLSFVYNF